VEILEALVLRDGGQPGSIAVPLFFTGPSPFVQSTQAAALAHLREPIAATNDLLVKGIGTAVARSIEAPVVTLDAQGTLELRAASVLGDLIQVDGTLSPDRSLDPNVLDEQGELTIEGDWQLTGGDLKIEIDGDPASLDFDRVTATGTVTLAGVLTVLSLEDAEYDSGDRFPILQADTLAGDFSAVNLPDIGEDLALELLVDHADGAVYLDVSGAAAAPSDPVKDPAAAVSGLRAFPNPVRSAAGRLTLAYSLASPGRVRMELFAVSGRRVATLLDAAQTAGLHEMRWAGGRNLASGAYILRMTASGRVEKHRVMVLR
jgi:hypothetical protein